MSGLHKCGFLGILTRLLRRVMCVGSRRGSHDSCYRELDDQELRDGSSYSTPSTNTGSSSGSGQKRFGEVVEEVAPEHLDNVQNVTRPLGLFKTLKKGSRLGTRSSGNGDEKILLDDAYPLNVELLLAKTSIWEFDTHELDRATGGRCLPILCMHLFSCYNLFSYFKLLPEGCMKLFRTIEQNYHASNLYHNSVHAADVTQAVHCFLQQPRLLKFLNPMEILVVLLAAITHDLDHPGVNHSFLVATRHPLAIIFKDKDFGGNDRTPFLKKKRKTRRLQEMLLQLAATRAEFSEAESSPEMPRPSTSSAHSLKEKMDQDIYETLTCDSILEHHHWRMAYSCILESGVFDHMSERLPEIKKMLRSLILATDITKQELYLNVFKDHLAHNTLDMQRADHRHIVLQMALKAADISNPGRPWVISYKWSQQVCTEFFAQGDKETELNLKVSSLCDRNKDSIPKIQKGFFRYVVMPLFTAWNEYLASDLSREMLKNLVNNEAEWTRNDQRSTQNSTSNDLGNVISDADNVDYDLETSTIISGSSELLVQSSISSAGSGSLQRVPRRSSHSPMRQSALKDAIRRFSAPLHIWPEPPKVVISLDLDSDDPQSGEVNVHKTIASVIIEESSSSSGSQPMSAGYDNNGAPSDGNAGHFRRSARSSDECLERLLGDSTPESKTETSSSNMIVFTPIKKAVDEIAEVLLPQLSITEPYHRRRGSAPAPIAGSELQRLASNLSLQLEKRKQSAASCHQRIAVEKTPAGYARRGSLPVEVMTACIST